MSYGKPGPEEPPAVRLVQGQAVSLGCGTLILIAIIVSMFSGGHVKDVEREVRNLRSEVVELKKSIDDQTTQIKALQDKVEKARPQ